MEYLKEYGVTDEQIERLKDRYNDGIIEFIEENEIFITNTIKYLYSEDIRCIYLLMINNIKIFLETPISLKRTIDEMKENKLSRKEIQLRLLQER